MLLEIILTLIPHLFEVAFKAKQEQNSAVFSCLTKSQCIMAEETARSFRIIIPIKPSAGEIPDCKTNFFFTRITAFLNDTDFFVPLVVLVGNVIFFFPHVHCIYASKIFEVQPQPFCLSPQEESWPSDKMITKQEHF